MTDQNTELSFISKKRSALEQSKRDIKAIIDKKCGSELRQIEQLDNKLALLKELEHEIETGNDPLTSPPRKLHPQTVKRLAREAEAAAK